MSLAPQGRMSDTICSGFSLCLPSAGLIYPGKVPDVLGDTLGGVTVWSLGRGPLSY